MKLLAKILLFLLIWLGVGCLAAWILSINPLREYGWFLGSIHGALAPFNWVISWFAEGWYVKAPLHTTAYNVFWWISFIGTLLGIPGNVIKPALQS